MPLTSSQIVAAALGAALVLAGALGFAADASFATGAQLEHGSLLGFEVNGWHNLVHLGSGLLLLAGASSRSRARGAWRLLLGLYALVLVAGLTGGDAIFGLAPVNTPDQLLHGALLAVAVWGTRAAKERRDVIVRDSVAVAAADGPRVTGPGSGHVGGRRTGVARIDARLPKQG